MDNQFIEMAEFHEKLDKIFHENFLNRHFQEKMFILGNDDCIYHYTSVEVVHSIINNNNFWVTKSDFLNDSSEFRYFWEIYNDFTNTEFIDNPKYHSFCADFYHYMEDKLKDHEESYESYVLSLSKNDDSLTLWSNYTKNNGYCICLSNDLIKDWPNEFPFFTIKYGKVIYDKNEQKNIIKDEFIKGYECYQEALENLKQSSFDRNEMIKEKINDGIFHRFLIWMMFFKSDLFKYEEEVRVIFTKFNARNDSVFKTFYRARDSFIVPYVKIPFNKNCIKKIKIGPTNHIDLAEKGIKLFLHAKEMDEVIVEKSKIPLRF